MARHTLSDDESLQRRSSSAQDHNPLVNVTSATSSYSSVPPTVFSEISRSRSNTPSSIVSSGDEGSAVEASKSISSTARENQHVRSSSDASTSSLSSRPQQAQATKSGHRPSWGLETIPQEGVELKNLSIPNNIGSDNAVRDSLQSESEMDPAPPLSEGSRVDSTRTMPFSTRTDSIWSNPRSWTPSAWPAKSVYLVQQKMTARIIYGLSTLVVTVFAAATAAYFAWRTYIMQLWQSEHDYFDWCRQAMADYPTKACEDRLKSELLPPPYAFSRVAEPRNLSTRSLSQPIKRIPVSVWTTETVATISLIVLCMVLTQFAATVLWQVLWRDYPAYQSLPQTDRPIPWHWCPRPNDPFAALNVRIEPQLHQSQTLSKEIHHDENADRKPKALKYRRIIPILEDLREQRDEEGHPPATRSTYKVPTWKQDDQLAEIITDDDASSIEKPLLDTASEDEVATQIGDALKDTTDDDRLLTQPTQSGSGPLTSFRRRLKRLTPAASLLRTNSMDDVDPPLTALGADNGQSDRRQNAVLSGHVALGLVQAGAALGSTAGGAIGKNILVQLVENESERIHNMLQSGISRSNTREESDYNKERDDFVQGVQPASAPPQLRRRPRKRSSVSS